MTLLILGLLIFIGTHAFTMARGRRAALIKRVGEGPYKGLYSILALAGIVLIVIGFGQYRQAGYIPVWNPPVWTRHIALALVLFAFIAVAAAYLPGRIRTALKHPMLAGVKIWAFAHLLANGDLGSILLFGSILAWAVAARINAKHRDEVTQHGGPAAAPAGWRNDVLAVVIGSAVYVVFAFWLHPVLIGVPVVPGRA
jgi:uncharacterized membrane protein